MFNSQSGWFKPIRSYERADRLAELIFRLSGPLQAFSDARFGNGRPAYQVTLASEAGGPVVTDTGVRLETVRLDGTVLSSVDTLLVAGGDLQIPPVSLQAKLAKISRLATSARLHLHRGIRSRRARCPGSCEATTHWAFCSQRALVTGAVPSYVTGIQDTSLGYQTAPGRWQ